MRYWTRREIVRAGGTLGVGTMMYGRVGWVDTPAPQGEIIAVPDRRSVWRACVIDDETVRMMALRAVDAARTAGATYADVRLTRIVREGFQVDLVSDTEVYALGVRARVDGAWGFAASPYWTLDEAVRLARDAVAQATVNARGAPPSGAWEPAPAASGRWVMPVARDPFAMPPEEKVDFMHAWMATASQYRRDMSPLVPRMEFTRVEHALATTDGTYVTQVTYDTSGQFVLVKQLPRTTVAVSARGLVAAGRGWELFPDADIPAQVPHLAAELDELARLPVRPVTMGRYEIVCDAATAAALVDGTIAAATELDRVMGNEANAGGTSYLGPDPMVALGTYDFGTPLLNVIASRNTPGGLANVRWDDEGIEPDSAALVTRGVVTDYQTTRETAACLAPWYARIGRTVRSHGYAAAPSALDIVMQHPPNITLAPSASADTMDTLIADVKQGYAFYGADVDLDHQARNGVISLGRVREIRNGKLGAIVAGAGISFATAALWKNLIAAGGASSVACAAVSRAKGEPAQRTRHSVQAVPLRFKELAVIDPERRA